MVQLAKKVSELFQDLLVQLTLDASVTAEVMPLVLGPNDYEAVRWFIGHCGRPAEAVSGGKARLHLDLLRKRHIRLTGAATAATSGQKPLTWTWPRKGIGTSEYGSRSYEVLDNAIS